MATYKRTAHRWRLLLVMLLGLLCAFGSFWLLQLMHQDEEAKAGGHGNEPDYIVENFSFVRMAENGKPRYLVSGARLTHRPVDDVSEIDKPVVQSLTAERARVTMHAERARVLHAKDQVDLLGNVDVVRPATPQSQALRIRTDALTVMPDDETMHTDRPIQMTLGGATVNGVGMNANNATQQLHLGGRGQIVYPPRQQR